MTSASAQACFSTGVSRSLSSEAIDKRLQQKQSSFIRSNRASASAQACFSTNVIRSLSSETIEYRLQQKQSRLQQEHSSLSGRNLAASFSRSGRAPGGAIEEELQQKLVEQSNQSAASAETVEIRPKQSSSGFSTSVPQHKRA